MMEKTLASLTDLVLEAGTFIQALKPEEGKATLVTLSGELGAGKTSFVQGVATALGVSDPVTSPTFVLEKIYELPETGPFNKLAHIDAYRLKGGEELGALGFSELMRTPGMLVMLEWPERVSDALPLASAAITLTVPESGGRTITYG